MQKPTSHSGLIIEPIHINYNSFAANTEILADTHTRTLTIRGDKTPVITSAKKLKNKNSEELEEVKEQSKEMERALYKVYSTEEVINHLESEKVQFLNNSKAKMDTEDTISIESNNQKESNEPDSKLNTELYDKIFKKTDHKQDQSWPQANKQENNINTPTQAEQKKKKHNKQKKKKENKRKIKKKLNNKYL